MEKDEKEKIKEKTRDLIEQISKRKDEIIKKHKDAFECKKLMEEYMNSKEYTEIRKKIIELNLNFIKSRVLVILKKYNERYISYGVEGMMKAIDKFDKKKNTSLLTYAQWWIDSSIKDGITSEKNSTAVPINRIDKIKKILATSDNISIDEIAAKTGFDKIEIINILESLQTPISLNYTVEDDSSELIEIIPDENESVEEKIDRILLSEKIEQLIERALEPRLQQIIRLRFGLDGPPQTYEQIGKKLKITRQRAMTLEKRAIIKLKKYIKLFGLDSYKETKEEKRTFL